jgi:hypothetical protein
MVPGNNVSQGITYSLPFSISNLFSSPRAGPLPAVLSQASHVAYGVSAGLIQTHKESDSGRNPNGTVKISDGSTDRVRASPLGPQPGAKIRTEASVVSTIEEVSSSIKL